MTRTRKHGAIRRAGRRDTACVLLTGLLLASCINIAKAQWRWRNPKPQGNDLWNVSFAPSSMTGWAVGGAGTIVRSTDGGSNWETQESRTDYFLRGVKAVTTSLAFAAGDYGVVLHTSDGGASWNSLTPPTTLGINQICVAGSANSLICVGDNGLMYLSGNGGASWSAVNSGVAMNLNDICFVDQFNGWCVGAGKTIIRTTDGGASWSPQFVSGPYSDLIGVFFLDANLGWAAGTGGTMLRTTNGGASWSRSMSVGTSQDMNKVVFLDPDNGYACGESGTLLHSTNGGNAWTPLSSGTIYGLEGIAAAGSGSSGRVLAAVGVFGSIVRAALPSGFAGVVTGNRNTLNAIAGAGASAVWAVGDAGTIIASTNAGNTWISQTSGATLPIYAICAADAQRAWACGAGGLLLRTTNGGGSWSPAPTGVTVALNGVDFAGSNTGFAVGSGGRILKSTDGGATWSPIASGTFKDLFGIDMLTETIGAVVGAEGTILHTTNGGVTWQRQTSWTQDALFSVVLSADNGWIAGDAGTILFTTDAGQNWDSTAAGTADPLFRIAQTSPNDLVAAGTDGLLLRSSDAGATWSREVSHAMYSFYAAAASGGVVYAAGDMGMVLSNASYPTPVELLSFTAEEAGAFATLQWRTAAETNNAGFTLERNAGGNWLRRAFIAASPGASYEFVDALPETAFDIMRYRLRQHDMDGRETVLPEAILKRTASPFARSMLGEPAPNPAAASSAFAVTLPSGGAAELLLTDALGRVKADLSSRLTAPDGVAKLIRLNPWDIPVPGAYFIMLRSGNTTAVRKLTVLK